MRCLACLLVALFWLSSAHADDLVATGSLEGQDTTWDTDTAGYGTLLVDYRRGWWSLSFLGKLGYGTVDERVLEYLDLGARFWHRMGRVSAYLRLGLAHQHEIPAEALGADAGTILGVGDGIRHRAGPSLRIGSSIKLGDHKYGAAFLEAHLGTAYFFENTKGPGWYWGGGLGIGLTYELGRTR